MKVWFLIGYCYRKHGTIKRWLNDMWYEIVDDETGIIYYVYPEFIEGLYNNMNLSHE